jgi:hypothetical protein
LPTFYAVEAAAIRAPFGCLAASFSHVIADGICALKLVKEFIS